MTEGKLLDVNNRADFEDFFNQAVDRMVEMFKKEDHAILPHAILFLIEGGIIKYMTITFPDPDHYIINGRIQNFPPGISNVPPMVIITDIIEKSGAEAYIHISQVWIRKNPPTKEESINDDKPGVIGSLQVSERREVLSCVGRTKDGKQTLSRFFEMKRDVPGGDHSKVLDMVKMEGWEVSKGGLGVNK